MKFRISILEYIFDMHEGVGFLQIMAHIVTGSAAAETGIFYFG